jgi:hypothetical protein
VFCEDFAALRLSFTPETHSYAQKWSSDAGFHGIGTRFLKSLISQEKFFCRFGELANALS